MTFYTGQKSFNYKTCGKSFAVSCHLPAHMKTHTKEEGFLILNQSTSKNAFSSVTERCYPWGSNCYCSKIQNIFTVLLQIVGTKHFDYEGFSLQQLAVNIHIVKSICDSVS